MPIKSDANRRAVAKYKKEKYDQIQLRVSKGQRENIKAHADKHDGGSVNAFINRAITNQMERDNTPDTDPTE